MKTPLLGGDALGTDDSEVQPYGILEKNIPGEMVSLEYGFERGPLCSRKSGAR